MSIQTTKELTRAEAEELAIDKFIAENRAKFSLMGDSELEDYIESTYYNYKVITE